VRRFYQLLTGAIVIAIAVVVLTRPKATPTPPQAQTPTPPQAQTPVSPQPQVPPKSDLAMQIAQLPEAKRPKIVAIGDSITYGYRVDESEKYPQQLERLLNDLGYPHMVYNAGVNKIDTEQSLPLLAGWLEKKPVLVIVELGINDAVPVEKTKENLAKMIRQSQAAGAKVVLSGQEANSYSRKLYEELAEEFKIPLIPDMTHGLGEVKGFQGDGVHCNPKGCLYMAEHNVLPVILPLLSKEVQ
jgi:acyl-CoA thioesterase-1